MILVYQELINSCLVTEMLNSMILVYQELINSCLVTEMLNSMISVHTSKGILLCSPRYIVLTMKQIPNT